MLLLLERPYRCLKCNRIRLGSVFLSFTSSVPRMPRRKVIFDNPIRQNMRCPECGGDVRRAHRNVFEKVLIFVRVYRCINCRTRFRAVRFG